MIQCSVMKHNVQYRTDSESLVRGYDSSVFKHCYLILFLVPLFKANEKCLIYFNLTKKAGVIASKLPSIEFLFVFYALEAQLYQLEADFRGKTLNPVYGFYQLNLFKSYKDEAIKILITRCTSYAIFLPIMIFTSNLFFFVFIVLAVISSSLQINSSHFEATQNAELDLFLCADKTKLIFLEYRCDGIPNCPDRSDENFCTCPDGQFRASSGYCVSSLIDFVQHRYCHSKNNRRACFKVCQPKEFRCSSAKCIPESKVCDGVADCDYSIDEWHECEPQEKKIITHGCEVDQLPCYLKTGIRCANFYEECFYYHLCEVDGCDPNFTCPKKSHWRCFGAPCLARKSLNDGKVDCLGGADETPNAVRWKKRLKPKIDSKLGVSLEASSAVYKFAKYMLSLFLICAIGVQLYMLKNNSSSRFKRRS